MASLIVPLSVVMNKWKRLSGAPTPSFDTNTSVVIVEQRSRTPTYLHLVPREQLMNRLGLSAKQIAATIPRKDRRNSGSGGPDGSLTDPDRRETLPQVSLARVPSVQNPQEADNMVLVTGATGFIGAALVSRLGKEGTAVLACDLRDPSPTVREQWGRNVRFETCDVCDTGKVSEIVNEAGKDGPVVHLAGILTAGCDLDPQAAVRVNIEGFHHVIDAASKIEKGPVVLASSIGVYGRGLPQPIEEGMRTEPDGWYGYTKLAGELMGLLYERRHNLDFRAARFAAVTGAGRSASSGSASLFTSFIAEKPALGEPYEIEVTEDTAYPVVYIKDAVDALYALSMAREAPRRIYNVSSGRVIVSEMIAHLKSRIPDAKFTFRPNPVVMAVVSGYKEWRISCTRIEEDLGWAPTFGVTEMIDDIIEVVRGRSNS